MTFSLLVAITGLVVAGANPPAPDSLTGPGAAVPYVGQEPLLCGGAAIAMVSRFWGETGVYATDFRRLVRPDEGGILTTDMEGALRSRGYVTRVVRGRPELVFEALRQGTPPVLLLGSDGTLLHYVVLVQASPGHVWVHDPALGPTRRMSREDLMARWSKSGYWTLLTGPEGREGAESVDAGDLAADPVSSRAFESLRAGRHAEARGLARGLLEGGPTEVRLGRRILATSYFLDGEVERALEEWNTLGEPRIDLVTVHGGATSRHDVWLGRLGLVEGRLLTPDDLARGRQRLASEPALESARVEYRPSEDGTVEVHAHVLEGERIPSLIGTGVEALRAVLSQRVVLEVGPLLEVADRWRFEGGWSPEQTRLSGSVRLSSPLVPGVTTLGLETRRERIGLEEAGEAGVSVEQRVRGYMGLHEWVGAHTRLGGELGLERWGDGDRIATATLSWLSDYDVVRARVEVEGGGGGDRAFARARTELSVQGSLGDHRKIRWRSVGETITDDAPLMTWPGAGTGRVRADLMRAYPLARDGAVGGLAFGRTLMTTGVDVRHFDRLGPALFGVGLFGEIAHVRRSPSWQQRTLFDAGAELFVSPGASEAALSVAVGERGWVVSARISEAW